MTKLGAFFKHKNNKILKKNFIFDQNIQLRQCLNKKIKDNKYIVLGFPWITVTWCLKPPLQSTVRGGGTIKRVKKNSIWFELVFLMATILFMLFSRAMK